MSFFILCFLHVPCLYHWHTRRIGTKSSLELKTAALTFFGKCRRPQGIANGQSDLVKSITVPANEPLVANVDLRNPQLTWTSTLWGSTMLWWCDLYTWEVKSAKTKILLIWRIKPTPPPNITQFSSITKSSEWSRYCWTFLIILFPLPFSQITVKRL